VWIVCRVVFQTGGFTPLYIASETGHVECVRALLGGGAEINQEKVGCTSSIARHCGDCLRRDAWESACVHACIAGRLRWDVGLCRPWAMVEPKPCMRAWGHGGIMIIIGCTTLEG
jgi:hypothetical protein